MPLYEYQCEACGHRFERIVKFSDPPVETCPSCGGRVHKQISSPAFQFKGTGWYITDYAKKDGGKDKADKADKAERAEKAEKGEKGEKSQDTKTESKDAPAKESSKSDTSASSSDSSSSTSASKPAAKD